MEGYSPSGNYSSKQTISKIVSSMGTKAPSAGKPSAAVSAASSNGFKTAGKFK